MTKTQTTGQMFVQVVMSIDDPDFCATAVYQVYAVNSQDASAKATDAAEREFGHAGRWTTESIRAL